MFSHGHWYAASRIKKNILLLHRILMGAKKDEHVDHMNGNSLDNRYCNLRLCTPGENNCNRPGRKGTSKFKGVSWHKQGHKWQASIAKDRRSYGLGLFNSEQDAAMAYNVAALQLHGQFAFLNKIGGQNV